MDFLDSHKDIFSNEKGVPRTVECKNSCCLTLDTKKTLLTNIKKRKKSKTPYLDMMNGIKKMYINVFMTSIIYPITKKNVCNGEN